MPPKKTTRGQKKKQNVIPIDEDKISDPSIPKENQEPETDLNKKPSTKRRGQKRKDPVNNNKSTNDADRQTVSPNTKTVVSTSKTTMKRRRITAAINEILNKDVGIRELAATAIAELTPINKLLELSDDDVLSEDEVQFNKNSADIEREPLTPITNDSNRIYNNILLDGMDESGNVDRIRNNDSYRSNEIHEPRFRLHYNTTPGPNRPREFNDDVFRLNPQKVFHLNTPFFTNDHSDARSTFQTSESTLPASFCDMGNIHQICSWLCANLSILLLAYNLYLSMQTPVATSFNLVTPNVNSATLATGILQALRQEDRVNTTIIYFVISSCCYCLITCIIQTKANRDFLEELKCLFLRARGPEKSAFEELVRQVFNYDLNSAEGIKCLRAASRNFSDFRNKFLDNIEEAVTIFKKKRVEENENIRHLEGHEINLFINENLMLNILQRWLSATNMTELKANHSLRTLQKFVQRAFVVNYNSRDVDATKALDKMTKNIAVPSRNGKNIASRLQL
ncbi:hypothetical protein GLOIN_2v1840951 [Rhizophagus irregularis DAOM 181602=DAOM 197198]|nr:hypothetical protein GLOIN_2v1840951 [Rhizophagus irregularis DAOM 181602=DAOM 197198]